MCPKSQTSKGVKCNEINACELKQTYELPTYITNDASNSSISIRAIVSSWTQEAFRDVRCSIYVPEILKLTFPLRLTFVILNMPLHINITISNTGVS